LAQLAPGPLAAQLAIYLGQPRARGGACVPQVPGGPGQAGALGSRRLRARGRRPRL